MHYIVSEFDDPLRAALRRSIEQCASYDEEKNNTYVPRKLYTKFRLGSRKQRERKELGDSLIGKEKLQVPKQSIVLFVQVNALRECHSSVSAFKGVGLNKCGVYNDCNLRFPGSARGAHRSESE